MTDGQTEVEYTRCTWAGVTFFPVVLLCQFFGFGRKWFLVLLTYFEYQSKTICENKNVSYEAHVCPIIVKAQRAPNAQATLQIVNRHYEEFLSPAALTLKTLRRLSNRSSPRQHFIRLCSHIVYIVYRRTWYVF
jgi:hypothetical protein